MEASGRWKEWVLREVEQLYYWDEEKLEGGIGIIFVPFFSLFLVSTCLHDLGQDCGICYEDFVEGDTVARLGCLCVFNFFSETEREQAGKRSVWILLEE
jgi:hypothetical protein